ncbi:MAG: hypothetical protein R2827_08630 [Bdellovibrionales bacterium]
MVRNPRQLQSPSGAVNNAGSEPMVVAYVNNPSFSVTTNVGTADENFSQKIFQTRLNLISGTTGDITPGAACSEWGFQMEAYDPWFAGGTFNLDGTYLTSSPFVEANNTGTNSVQLDVATGSNCGGVIWSGTLRFLK